MKPRMTGSGENSKIPSSQGSNSDSSPSGEDELNDSELGARGMSDRRWGRVGAELGLSRLGFKGEWGASMSANPFSSSPALSSR